ncbi:MAG: D-aminoacyl-tRNA deacylase [Polyangiaceae bacterium]
MRAVVQRVLSASVEVDGQVLGSIGRGLVAFVGAAEGDGDEDMHYTIGKMVGLRVFPDESGKMTRSLAEIGGEMLAISQFTVFGDVRRGLRPSFDGAMAYDVAEPLWHRFLAELRAHGIRVETGRFRADMKVRVENDGPVTILIDSRKAF